MIISFIVLSSISNLISNNITCLDNMETLSLFLITLQNKQKIHYGGTYQVSFIRKSQSIYCTKNYMTRGSSGRTFTTTQAQPTTWHPLQNRSYITAKGESSLSISHWILNYT